MKRERHAVVSERWSAMMGGYSGSATASHTRLAFLGDTTLAISQTQHRLLRTSLAIGDVILKRRELHSAEILEALRLGTVVARGSGDGKHVVFRAAEGVTVKP